MAEFEKEVWGIFNTKTGKLVSPFKTSYQGWFRGLYESEHAAKVAMGHLVNKLYGEYTWRTSEYYGYIPVKIKKVNFEVEVEIKYE